MTSMEGFRSAAALKDVEATKKVYVEYLEGKVGYHATIKRLQEIAAGK